MVKVRLIPEFEKAQLTAADSDAQIVIGSVQTLTNDRRLNAYPHNAFDLIIVDEAHHCLSSSYQKVLKYFNNARVLGVTATPDRNDKKDLSTFFDSIAFEYPIYEPTFKWELEPPTQKQIELIEKFNISAEGIDSRGKATKLIDVLMRRVNEHLSTAKQIRLLERYGFKSVGTWTLLKLQI